MIGRFLRQHFGEERERLFLRGRFQRLVVVAVLGRGLDRAVVAHRQPLAAEVLHELLRLRIGEHPLDLRGDRRPGRAACRPPPGEQLVVRHRAPEEIRQPRRQFVVGQRRAALAGCPRALRERESPARTARAADPSASRRGTTACRSSARRSPPRRSRRSPARSPAGDRPAAGSGRRSRGRTPSSCRSSPAKNSALWLAGGHSFWIGPSTSIDSISSRGSFSTSISGL